MIKLYAVVYLLVSGATAPTPEDTYTYNKRTFDTVQACQDFIKSDEFQDTNTRFTTLVTAEYGPDARVIYECK